MLTRVDLTCLAAIDVRVPTAPTLTRSSGPGAGGPEDAPEGAIEEPSPTRRNASVESQ